VDPAREYKPGVHGMQFEPFLEYPAAQIAQSAIEEAPLFEDHFPVGQLQQLDKPVWSLNHPEAQKEQASDPIIFAKLPAAHGVNVCEPERGQ
jgi:hypothetical protein